MEAVSLKNDTAFLLLYCQGWVIYLSILSYIYR